MSSIDEQVTLPASAIVEAAAVMVAAADTILRFTGGQDTSVTGSLESGADDLLAAAGVSGPGSERHPLRVEATARTHELNGDNEIAERVRAFGNVYAEVDEWVDEQPALRVLPDRKETADPTHARGEG